MNIERTSYDEAVITLDEDTAHEWARDPYGIDTEAISEQLRDCGFGKQWYVVEGSVDVSLTFTVRVEATSEDEASDIVGDNVSIDEYTTAQGFEFAPYDSEHEIDSCDAEMGSVDIHNSTVDR